MFMYFQNVAPLFTEFSMSFIYGSFSGHLRLSFWSPAEQKTIKNNVYIFTIFLFFLKNF